MSDENIPQQPPESRARRSSFAGQTFADIFGTGRSTTSRQSSGDTSASPPNAYPGPITSAAAQARQRRLSLTTVGLGASPKQASPFSYRTRQDSLGSANSGSVDESAIEDEPSTGNDMQSTPTTPFARRMSFGARAMRDIRTSVGGGGSPPAQNGAGEGFNWSDNLRTRAERGSISGASGGVGGGVPFTANHPRAKSVATMEPPVREMPRESKRPDHFQERILKGDFYMD